jgi:hypothetical protein
MSRDSIPLKKNAIRGVGSIQTLGGQSVNSKIEIDVSKFSSSSVLQKNLGGQIVVLPT